ncbi:MAG: acetyl-CoA carboxylase biotin carboxyl carrier protein subunit, partial [Bacteroidales bacterium]
RSFERKKKFDKSADSGVVRIEAPLPGKVIEILVSDNQPILKGEPILILEAMKMQNEILSQFNGTIRKVYVGKDETVMKDQLLIEIDIKK